MKQPQLYVAVNAHADNGRAQKAYRFSLAFVELIRNVDIGDGVVAGRIGSFVWWVHCHEPSLVGSPTQNDGSAQLTYTTKETLVLCS